MQSGGKGPKWEEHARLGIYLGNSLVHARSVALVLNMETGLASPQFHIEFDNLFETVSKAQVKIHWYKATGFTTSGLNQAEQGPPMPSAYFLPQSQQEQLTDESGSESLMNLESYHSPQGKMGSMTDTRQYAEPNKQDARSKETLEMTETANTSHEETEANTTVNQCKVSVNIAA